jgi:hypothetical protein
MRSKLAWAIAAIAIAAVVAVAIVIGRFWNTIGAADISPGGWLAMGSGIVATLALGIGLMALMFFSSRHGYDGAEGEDRRSAPPIPGSRGADSDAARAERQQRPLKIGK